MKLQLRRIVFGFLISATALAAIAGRAMAQDDSEFNESDNYLIADQFNNRVIEVDPNGNIVWQFGLGPADFSSRSIIGTNDAQRVGSLTLMAGTGTPGGQPEAPNCTDLLAAQTTACCWSTVQVASFGNMDTSKSPAPAPIDSTLQCKIRGFLPRTCSLLIRRTSALWRSI